MNRLVTTTIIIVSSAVIAYFANVAHNERRAASATLAELRNAQEQLAKISAQYATVTNLPEYKVGQKIRTFADNTRTKAREFANATRTKTRELARQAEIKINALVSRKAN